MFTSHTLIFSDGLRPLAGGLRMARRFICRFLELMAISSLFYNSPMSVNLKISLSESKSRSKAKSRCNIKLLREPEQVLTPLFLELIKKAYDDNKIVIMFDVFERTSDALSPWLLMLFNFEYGEFDTRVMFVVSGRESLEQHWTELAGLVCHNSLEPFTLDELQLYLSNHDITDNELVNQIYEDTNGLPVLVELLAAAKPQPGMPLPDVSIKISSLLFLKQIQLYSLIGCLRKVT
jgi:hypothetical protein